MAAEPMLWAMKLLPLLANDSQRVVLIHLAWRANPDGLLWPSIADMAMELGKSARALRRSLRELDSEQIINVDADFRNDGSQGSNYYQCLLAVTPQDVLKRRKESGRGAIMSTSRKRFATRMERYYKQLDCWAAALSAIRNEIDRHTFNTWYAPLKFRGINKRSLILGIPSENFEVHFRDRRSRNIILTAAKPAFSLDLVSVYFRFQK
jgi:hypothetical protein